MPAHIDQMALCALGAAIACYCYPVPPTRANATIVYRSPAGRHRAATSAGRRRLAVCRSAAASATTQP